VEVELEESWGGDSLRMVFWEGACSTHEGVGRSTQDCSTSTQQGGENSRGSTGSHYWVLVVGKGELQGGVRGGLRWFPVQQKRREKE